MEKLIVVCRFALGVPFLSQYDWKMLRLGDATGEFDGLDTVEEEEVVEEKLVVVETVVVVEHESMELSRTSLGLV